MRAKAPLQFANWAPDTSQISGAAAEAKGVVSLGGRYAPDKDFLALKTGAAIGDRCLGGKGFYENGVNARLFVADAGKIYEVVARVPVDKSKIGGYAVNPDWGWTFEQFGETIVASAKGLSQLQFFTFGSSTAFADIATGPGNSDTIFRVREFLFSAYNRTLKNSAFNNFTDWVPDSGTQSTEFDLPSSGGNIVKGVGGQFGIVFQERKVHRLTYQGSSGAPFQRDEIEDKRGALGPHAVCRYGALTFFASEDGIRVTDGASESEALGNNSVDRYFASRLNYVRRARVVMACDVKEKLLRIAFPAGGNERPNEMLIYSIGDRRWTHDDCELDMLFEAPRPGVAIDDDTGIAAIAGSSVIDNVNVPIDSSAWLESRKQIMAVNFSGEVGTFEGPNRAATVETGYGEIQPGRKGYVSEIWPLIDAGTINCSVTTKLARLSDTPVNHPISAMNEFGFCPVDVEARWMRIKSEVPYGQSWSECVGIDWDGEAAGEL